MKPKTKAIIIDLDGTLCEFTNKDKEIISSIYNNNMLVNFVDYLLCKINKMDLFKNSPKMLKLRLNIYSAISFNYDFSNNYLKYQKRYIESTVTQLEQAYETHIAKLKQEGYTLIILTNNIFSKDVFEKCNFKEIELFVTVGESKNKAMTSLKQMFNGIQIEYFIGNNVSDDIIASKKNNLSMIYVGSSEIAKLLCGKINNNSYVFDTFDDAVEFILCQNDIQKTT